MHFMIFGAGVSNYSINGCWGEDLTTVRSVGTFAKCRDGLVQWHSYNVAKNILVTHCKIATRSGLRNRRHSECPAVQRNPIDASARDGDGVLRAEQPTFPDRGLSEPPPHLQDQTGSMPWRAFQPARL